MFSTDVSTSVESRHPDSPQSQNNDGDVGRRMVFIHATGVSRHINYLE